MSLFLDSMETYDPDSGPGVYENWREHDVGAQGWVTWKVYLYSDAVLSGGGRLGPYEFIDQCPPETSLIHGRLTVSRDPSVASLLLQFTGHLPFRHFPPKMTKTQVTSYHGGSIVDEVAALLSLSMGVRLKPGAIVDERALKPGIPPTHVVPNPQPPRIVKVEPSYPRLPRQVGAHSVYLGAPLIHYSALDPHDARVLVRVARLYQDALWIAESEPSLAWLLLVSAVEAAAGRWKGDKPDPLKLIKEFKPELSKKIEAAAGDGVLLLVANELAPTMGVKRRFVEFLLTFAPPPPQPRPVDLAQVEWTPNNMRCVFKKLYDCRSKALHNAIAMPGPMCDSPYLFRQDEGLVERFMGTGAAGQGGIWTADDAPMLIATFEYIARHALLKWWAGLPVKSGDNDRVT